MAFLHRLWFFVNLLLILLILIRSPNDQSLQARLSPLKFFESYESAEKNVDRLIQSLIFAYFLLGFLLLGK